MAKRLVLLSLLVLLCGCQTVKGVAEGVGVGVVQAGKGIAKDSSNVWHSILKADGWIKKNMW